MASEPMEREVQFHGLSIHLGLLEVDNDIFKYFPHFSKTENPKTCIPCMEFELLTHGLHFLRIRGS